VAEERLVLSDASPLIGLAAADGFELLHRLFSVVSVTPEVRAEVLADEKCPGAPQLRAALRARWIRVLRGKWPEPEFSRLGDGEASILRAAANLGGDALVLLDDEAARREAVRLGIAVTGTLGILAVARRRSLVPAVRPYLARLAEHGFYFSQDLARELLRSVGEQ
jgi:predicted nucleic acid-binding protein